MRSRARASLETSADRDCARARAIADRWRGRALVEYLDQFVGMKTR